MKTIKRIVCIVLCLLMVLSIAACGEKETPSDSSSTVANNSSVVEGSSEDATPSDEVSSTEAIDSGTSSTVSLNNSTDSTSSNQTNNKQTSLTWSQVKAKLPENASGKTVEIMDWNSQTTMSKQVCDAFTKETGIKVTFSVEGYTSYMAKIASRVATGNPPTVARLRDNTPEYMISMQPIQNTGYNFNDTYWDEELLDAYTFNGKTYGVNLVNSPYYQPVVTFYNQKLIDKYDLEDPYDLWKAGKWTWDKMFELCEVFLEEAGDKYFGLTPLFGEYVYATGNTYIKFENGKFVNNVSSQGVIKAMQYLNDAHKKGLLTDELCLRDDFSLGKGLFLFDAEIGARTGHFYFRELKNSGDLRAVPVPAVKGQKDYYVCISELEAYGIVNKCANVELAPFFLRYYLDASNYDMEKFYSHESVLEVVNWTRQYEGIPTYFNYWQAGMPKLYWTSEKSQINQLVASNFSPYITSTLSTANPQISKLVQ